MKKLRKLFLTVMVLCLCLSPLSLTASAADLVDPDNINSIAQYFGTDMSDPESIQSTINQIQNGGLSGVLSLLGIDVSDIINELSMYIQEPDTTTASATTEATTAEEITTAPATTKETTTEKTVVETTVIEKPVYIPVTEKAKEETTVISAESSEESTEEASKEASQKEIENITETAEEEPNSEISSTTVFVVLSTICIFIIGLVTGIAITKYLANKQRFFEG